ncbi:hypothetical protein [Novosphingobium kaempferiae]|uniref:hypothetical protein n=1 Tax=Novosphingobium kaempferiae TaxID=2896849 RepID=UPI001E5F475C|nr:hypothetical protein [Novosphingobium kaempferiae]
MQRALRISSSRVAGIAAGLAVMALIPALPALDVQAARSPAAVVLVVGHAPAMM